jgi:hypothetical protein
MAQNWLVGQTLTANTAHQAVRCCEGLVMKQSRWKVAAALLFLIACIGVIVAFAMFMPNAGGYLALAALVALLTTGVNSLFGKKK